MLQSCYSFCYSYEVGQLSIQDYILCCAEDKRLKKLSLDLPNKILYGRRNLEKELVNNHVQLFTK